MRYWYLKGGDVLGPMEPEQIVKDADFSMEALVCPEHESEKEDSWKTPQDYMADFGPAIQVKTTVPADRKTAQTAALIEEISPEETIHSRSPLTASLENNLLDDLPAEALLPKDTQKDAQKTVKPAEPKAQAAKPQPAAQPASAGENKPAQPPASPTAAKQSADIKPLQAKPQPSFFEESLPDLSDSDIDDVFTERISESFDEDTFTPKAAPQPVKAAAENSQKKPAPAPKQDLQPVQSADTFTGKSAMVIKSGDEIPHEGEGLLSSAAAAPANHQAQPKPAAAKQIPDGGIIAADIFSKNTLTPDHGAISGHKMQGSLPHPAGIMPTTNGKIINSIDSSQPHQQGKKKDKLFLMMLIMFIVISAALFMAFFYNEAPRKPLQNERPSPAANTQQPEPARQGIEESPAAQPARVPGASPEQLAQAVKMPGLTQQEGSIVVAPQQSPTAEAISERLVKEYLLDTRRGTIKEYFEKTYPGYTVSWQTTHLHQNTYVVEFSAAKVRQEPIRYLFRVNIDTRRVEGLNNISVNLLSN